MSKRYRAIGLMSGTSLDGVDAAVLETDGEKIFAIGKTYCRPYSKAERVVLERATQAALKWIFNGPQPNQFAHAQTVVHAAHIEAVKALMQKNEHIDLIGFHGQTVLHKAPKSTKDGRIKGQTLQLGDGQVLADALGIDVVYDFRSADIAAGGQGAPLAPIYHQALLKYSKIDGPVGVLNIGGVSNITIAAEDGTLLASDCGPGNGPLDSWVQQCGLGNYDDGGKIGREGNPDFALIDTWLERAFFARPMPKSADRWDFDVLADLKNHSPKDGAASLALFTVLAIAKSIHQYAHQYGQSLDQLIVCGGGRHNTYMTWLLAAHTCVNVINAETIDWNGDDLEAQAFAYLAVRSIKGLPLSFVGTTGVPKPICGGKLAKA